MKKIIKKLLKTLGFSIIRTNKSLERFSQEGSVENLNKVGFMPSIVVDGGGAYGNFSLMVSKFFPESRYFIVEPLIEYKNILEKNVKKLNHKIFYNALSNNKETISINVHHDLVGTSIFEEYEEDNNGNKRDVDTILLSELINDKDQILIKLDLQGAEILALEGGLEVLKQSRNIVVMCEASFFKFYKSDRSKIYDLMQFFDSIDYELYDVYGPSFRPYDNAMAQIDVVFCHKESKLKSMNIYADKDKREAHNKKYIQKHKDMGIH
ncbi:FkbM family methyltransferase [Arcobacter arenosus]|uniref:FkbM family methyltransferase n=1 Tax=Arcobacter arenosus TaxID=2576037 RepID=UPI003BACF3E8